MLGSNRNSEVEVSNELVRDLALIKQGLDAMPVRKDGRTILDTIRKIKLLQLDTINVVDRSHYLVMLSRIGPYDKADLDALSYPQTSLIEQRSHATCLIPIESYPFLWPELLARRRRRIEGIKRRQLGPDANGVFKTVMDRIRADGAIASKDFEDARKGERKGWWDRKPERAALEILWKRGYLAVQRKGNFQCYYDLAERVIPNRYLESTNTLDDFRRWATANSLEAQA
jgi:hypothetical protein